MAKFAWMDGHVRSRVARTTAPDPDGLHLIHGHVVLRGDLIEDHEEGAVPWIDASTF
jgi:hypothetical protein